MIYFRDCPQCGKRIRSGAVKCHHCQAAIVASDNDEPEGSEEYADGGYADEDFDYDEYIESEFGNRPRRIGWLWSVVAWLLIALMLGGAAMTLLVRSAD